MACNRDIIPGGSGWSGSLSDEVREVGDVRGVGDGEVVPDGDAVLGAGLDEAEKSIPAVASGV
jgi:hypothetical protein